MDGCGSAEQISPGNQAALVNPDRPRGRRRREGDLRRVRRQARRPPQRAASRSRGDAVKLAGAARRWRPTRQSPPGARSKRSPGSVPPACVLRISRTSRSAGAVVAHKATC